MNSECSSTCIKLEESTSSKRGDVVIEQFRQIPSDEIDRLCGNGPALLGIIRDSYHWADCGYASFKEFVRNECPFGLRKAQELIRIHRVFGELELTSEQLNSIEWSKAATVLRVINRDNRDSLLDALTTESLREIRQRVQRMIALQSHLEESPVHKGQVVSPGVKKSVRLVDSSSDLIDWRLPRPDESEFYVAPKVWDQICFEAAHSGCVLLVGPSGCGKSTLVEKFAQRSKRPLAKFNFGAMSDPRSALIGNTHLSRAKGTTFKKSNFVSAIESPNTCVLLDEVSRSGCDPWNIILTLLDHQGYLCLDESEDSAIIHRAENVCFFGTANAGLEYTGTSQLDKALTGRFHSVIPLDFPPFDKELAILLSGCPGLDDQDAKQMLRIAQRQRDQADEGDFLTKISTRLLLAAGRQVAGGISLVNALEFCILNHFFLDDDGGDVGERARLQQLFARFVE
ncbi:AAA family ATPase [Gimesia chilikensis]|uniref:Chaperone BssE n=1 Tax=Gimesia chilikensis TaxID=2605989 RepID=A0A517PSY9_9PLAN|nr:AAA family ATPase [Gimesia chilikensis]QDT22483.1 Putative chaperone BssE [Gimesia chilikensis]